MKSGFTFLFCLLFSSLSWADATIDLGLVYSSDTFKATPEAANNQYFYNASALFNLDNKARWNMGFAVLGISQTAKTGTTETSYSSFDLGPAVRWNIDKNRIFSLTLAYGYLAKASYSVDSGAAEKWEGTSLLGQFAVQAPIQDKFYVGLSLNYYSATYSKKVVSSVESSNDAQKSWIFPMINLTWRP